MRNKVEDWIIENMDKVLFFAVLVILCLSLLGCKAHKAEHHTAITDKEQITIADSTATNKDVFVNTLVYKGAAERFFLPEYEGKLPNFDKKLTSGATVVHIYKTEAGLNVELEQEDIISTDTLIKKDVNKSKTTTTNHEKDTTEYEKIIVTKWSKFQWFLLVFFGIAVGIGIFKLVKKIQTWT